MVRALALAAALLVLPAGGAGAFEYANAAHRPPTPTAEAAARCILGAARAHDVDEFLLLLILRVENGRLGRISHNASGAPPDIGPAQVNGQWLPRLAARWGVDRDTAFRRLRDDFCANLDAAGWIARLALDNCGAGFWRCFAGYHSPTERFQRRYLGLVAREVRAILKSRRGDEG